MVGLVGVIAMVGVGFTTIAHVFETITFIASVMLIE
jgi:hypothetical protein